MGLLYKGIKKGLLLGAGPVKAILGSLVAGELSKSVGPVIKDAVEDYQEQQKHLVRIPDVQAAGLNEAKDFLQSKGFYVTEKLVQPSKSLKNKTPGDIIKLSPKAGTKVEPGSMVVIYYVDQAVIEASQDITIELMDVEGMPLDRAVKHLQARGFQVEICPLNPSRKYQHHQANTVVRMSPKPSMFKKAVSGETVIKLYTLTPEVIAKSQSLAEAKTSKDPHRTILDYFKREKKQ